LSFFTTFLHNSTKLSQLFQFTIGFNPGIFLAARTASVGDIFQLAILFFNKLVARLSFQSLAKFIILFLIAQELPDILIPNLVKDNGNNQTFVRAFHGIVNIFLPVILHINTKAPPVTVHHKKKFISPLAVNFNQKISFIDEKNFL